MSQSYHIINKVELIGNQLLLNGHVEIECNDDMDQFAKVCYQTLHMQYPKFYKMDTASKWGLVCSEFLLQNQQIDAIDSFKRAIVLQNSSSSLRTDRYYQQSLASFASPALFVYTLANIVMGEIAIKNHFKGENTFFVSAKWDAQQLDQYLEMLFVNQVANLAIAGYIEVSSAKPHIVLFLAGSQ